MTILPCFTPAKLVWRFKLTLNVEQNVIIYMIFPKNLLIITYICQTQKDYLYVLNCFSYYTGTENEHKICRQKKKSQLEERENDNTTTMVAESTDA